MRRSAKLGILITILCLTVVAISLVVYFVLFRKDAYQITAVEHTAYRTSDFKGSELKLYQNGTFHIQIIYDGSQVFFIGVGTYTKKNNRYELTFTQAVGREGDTVSDQMDKFTTPLVCSKSGKGIKFTDHNKQVYYFG